MAKLWSTKDLLGQDGREILVWHPRLNHCSFKSLTRIYNIGILPSNLRRVRKLPPCVTCMFGKSHKRPWRTKGNLPGCLTRKPSDNRPRAVTSIDQMVYYQPGITLQFNGAITHVRLWADTVFLDHYSRYCYDHLMRGNSAEKSLQAEEAYERLSATHIARVYTYMVDIRWFVDPIFKEEFQTCGH